MKHFGKILLVAISAISLTSCDFLSLIFGESGYDNYEDYFIQDLKYEKFTDMDSFNKKLGESAYFWSTYEGSSSTSYYTSKALLFSVYKSRELVSFNSTYGHDVDVERKDGVVTFSCKEAELKETAEGIKLTRGIEGPLKVENMTMVILLLPTINTCILLQTTSKLFM